MRMVRLELARALPTRTSSVRVYQFRHIRITYLKIEYSIKNKYSKVRPNFRSNLIYLSVRIQKFSECGYQTDRNLAVAQEILNGVRGELLPRKASIGKWNRTKSALTALTRQTDID
jgi:hypothetical protein